MAIRFNKKRFREILEKRDLSLSDVQRIGGFGYASLHRLTSGKTQSVDFGVLDRLCEVGECDISDLLVRDGDR